MNLQTFINVVFTDFCDINIVFRNTWHSFKCVAMVLNVVQCVEAMRLWRKIKWIPSAAVGEANIALLWLSACGRDDKLMMSFTFIIMILKCHIPAPNHCHERDGSIFYLWDTSMPITNPISETRRKSADLIHPERFEFPSLFHWHQS